MQVVLHSVIYLPFFTEKTPENTDLSKTQTTWYRTSNWSYELKEIWDHLMDAGKKTRSQMDSSSIHKHLRPTWSIFVYA